MCKNYSTTMHMCYNDSMPQNTTHQCGAYRELVCCFRILHCLNVLKWHTCVIGKLAQIEQHKCWTGDI